MLERPKLAPHRRRDPRRGSRACSASTVDRGERQGQDQRRRRCRRPRRGDCRARRRRARRREPAMTPMRVRFAPSPTGHLHVGNARTALFNWLLARGHGGTFVPAHRGHRRRAIDARVRAERSSTTCAGSGSTGTRGRTSAGRIGPYRQSERLELLRGRSRAICSARGRAYRCFCTPERARGRARRRRWRPGCRRSTAAGAARSIPARGRARASRAGERGGDPLSRAAGARRHVPRPRPRRRDVQHRRHRRSGHRPIRRPARLQLRRRHRRRARWRSRT